MALTDRQARQANAPGVLVDGHGLRQNMSQTSAARLSKRWVLRYLGAEGRWREAGLGGFPEVVIAEARELASKLRGGLIRLAPWRQVSGDYRSCTTLRPLTKPRLRSLFEASRLIVLSCSRELSSMQHQIAAPGKELRTIANCQR
jgi:hypothetical protein